MKSIISSDICQKCGECCKNYPFVELSPDEVHELEKLTRLPLDVFTDRKDEAVEEYFLTFNENGDCYFLKESGDGYSCGVYEARSSICRSYPSEPSQNRVCHANREKVLRKSSR